MTLTVKFSLLRVTRVSQCLPHHKKTSNSAGTASLNPQGKDSKGNKNNNKDRNGRGQENLRLTMIGPAPEGITENEQREALQNNSRAAARRHRNASGPPSSLINVGATPHPSTTGRVSGPETSALSRLYLELGA